MADVKTISGVFTGMLNILLPKSRFRFGLGIMFWQVMERRCRYGVPCGDERDYAFANFFKAQSGMQEIKYFLMLTFLKKPTVLKTT
jgi:leucyl-tRNA synthetase